MYRHGRYEVWEAIGAENPGKKGKSGGKERTATSLRVQCQDETRRDDTGKSKWEEHQDFRDKKVCFLQPIVSFCRRQERLDNVNADREPAEIF